MRRMRKRRRARRSNARRRRRRRNYSHWIPSYRTNPRRRKRGRRAKGRKRRAKRRNYGRRRRSTRRRSTRRRRRNVGMNPRRRRRRRKTNVRRRRGGRRRRNPVRTKRQLSIKKPVSMLMAGYDLPIITSAATITAGALGNNALYRLVSANVPMFPDFLKAGPGAIAGKLGMAGVTGALTGMVSSKLAPEIFYGGVVQAVMDAFNEYVVPNVPGLSDYATVQDLQRARPLGEMTDYASVQDLQRARALGAIPGEDEADTYVAEELAAIA